MRSAKRLTGFLIPLVLSGTAVAEAQSIWLPRSEPAIAIEGLKPFFDGGDFSFFSTAWYLSGRGRVSGSLILVAEVPLSFGKISNEFFESDSEVALGNIYLGLEIGKEASPLFFEVGARAPIAPETKSVATLVGTFADLDRWEAFVPNLLPITALANYFNVSETGLLLRFRGGPVLWIPTSGGDVELLALLNAQVGYEDPNGKYGVKGGFTGRIIVTENGSIGDRASFQAGANGWFGLGRVRPGVLVLVPLDSDLQDLVNVTVGLNAQILLN